jgi:uncharacterized protein GlcG (DUF336 family)
MAGRRVVFHRPSLAHDLARRLISAAEEEAAAIDQPLTIAVVDESGVLKAFVRMDGAPLLTVQLAQDKAYTAAGFGLTTGEWRDMLAADAQLAIAAPAAINRLVAIGGGAPISIDGVIVGGIGVSGGTPDQDADVASAALSVLEIERHARTGGDFNAALGAGGT